MHPRGEPQGASTSSPLPWDGKNASQQDMDVLAADFAQLACTPLDLKRWLNVALARLGGGTIAHSQAAQAPEGAAAGHTDALGSVKQSEARVNRLITYMQAHTQEVGSAVEELISQTVLRLPRTTVELSRMVNEAQELTDVLQGIHDLVKSPDAAMNAPASSGGVLAAGRGEEYLQRLQELRDTQTKLQRCWNVLSKAAAVDTNMEKIALALQSSTARRRSRSRNAEDIDLSGLPQEVDADLAQVGCLIQQVQRDMQEVGLVDPTYAEKRHAALERYEQEVESTLEKKCLERLVHHEAARSAELFQTLALIGRVDTVLPLYTKRVAQGHVEHLRNVLSHGPEGGGDAGIGPADAADALCQELMPAISACLAGELDFLLDLVDETAARRLTQQQSHGTPGEQGGGALLHGSLDACRGDSGGDLVLQVMTHLIEIIGEALAAALQPVLGRVKTNAELVLCYDAVTLVEMESHEEPGAQSPHSAGETGPASAIACSHTIVPLDPPTRLKNRKRYAAQIRVLALNAFTLTFQQTSIFEEFCTRTDERLRIYTHTRPPSQLQEGAPYASFLHSASRKGLCSALREGLHEVLRFFPEKTAPLCIAKWYSTLSSATVTALQAASSHTLPPTPWEAQSRAVLKRLHLTVNVLRPVMRMMQKDTELFLTAVDVQQRYPSRASAVLQNLVTQLWTPLLGALEASVKECQEALKQILLEPVVAKTALYTALPVWCDGGKAQVLSPLHSPHLQPDLSLSTNFSSGYITPSELVRELGEAILEIPLTLEDLRTTSVNAFDEAPSLQGDSTADPLAPPPGPRDGVEELLPEVAESWLSDTVHAAVKDFVLHKVLRVRIDFSGNAHAPSAARGVSLALQQLSADLDYLRSVLSAVSDERFEELERMLKRIDELRFTLPELDLQRGGPFLLKELIQEPVTHLLQER